MRRHHSALRVGCSSLGKRWNWMFLNLIIAAVRHRLGHCGTPHALGIVGMIEAPWVPWGRSRTRDTRKRKCDHAWNPLADGFCGTWVDGATETPQNKFSSIILASDAFIYTEAVRFIKGNPYILHVIAQLGFILKSFSQFSLPVRWQQWLLCYSVLPNDVTPWFLQLPLVAVDGGRTTIFAVRLCGGITTFRRKEMFYLSSGTR